MTVVQEKELVEAAKEIARQLGLITALLKQIVQKTLRVRRDGRSAPQIKLRGFGREPVHEWLRDGDEPPKVAARRELLKVGLWKSVVGIKPELSGRHIFFDACAELSETQVAQRTPRKVFALVATTPRFSKIVSLESSRSQQIDCYAIFSIGHRRSCHILARIGIMLQWTNRSVGSGSSHPSLAQAGWAAADGTFLSSETIA